MSDGYMSRLSRHWGNLSFSYQTPGSPTLGREADDVTPLRYDLIYPGDRIILYLCTYTYTIMATRTISINDEAYDRLFRLKSNSNLSFSEVILKFTPPKRALTDVLREFGPNPELADAIEQASTKMRQARMREVPFNADA